MSKEALTPQPEDLDLSDRKRIYLEGIRAGLDYSESSALAGVDRSTSYRWRQDPEFAALVEQAKEVSIDNLEREAHRRAMKGSDRLLEFLLVNRAPEKYQSTRKVELSGHLALGELSEDEIRAELAAAMAAAGTAVLNPDDDISDLV